MTCTSSLHGGYCSLLPSPSSGHLHHIFRVFYGVVVPKLRVFSNAYFYTSNENPGHFENKNLHVLYVSVFSSPGCTCNRSAWTIFFLRKSAMSRPSFKLFLKAPSSVTEYCSNASFLIFCRNALQKREREKATFCKQGHT